jgi:hypothetical protein
MSRFVPRLDRCKQALVLLGALIAAGCGGTGHADGKLVSGTGYTFSAPKGWQIARSARQVQVADSKGAIALVAVSRFPLRHTFRPPLWPKVVRELDAAADGIARQQHGSVTDTKDVTISRERSRRYKVAYDLNGKKLVEELAFVLRGKTEYLLLCRYEQSKSHDACDTLMSSFRLI